MLQSFDVGPADLESCAMMHGHHRKIQQIYHKQITLIICIDFAPNRKGRDAVPRPRLNKMLAAHGLRGGRCTWPGAKLRAKRRAIAGGALTWLTTPQQSEGANPQEHQGRGGRFGNGRHRGVDGVGREVWNRR
ncbi:MAG: hypothetical protein O9341_01085, partial [Paucibacter sp.]|nr:hypothetical protein [Roseateles sp.]